MSDWWSRKIGNQPSPPPRTPPSTMPSSPSNIRFPQVQQPAPQAHSQVQASVDANGEINMGEAIRSWKGGEAARRETHDCPECGSSLVFSRSKGMINGHSPAPRCYCCGWNGKYSQADQSSWSI
jgi:hypothetical protein